MGHTPLINQAITFDRLLGEKIMRHLSHASGFWRIKPRDLFNHVWPVLKYHSFCRNIRTFFAHHFKFMTKATTHVYHKCSIGSHQLCVFRNPRGKTQ